MAPRFEIEGRDRRPVQRGRRIADHNGFQALFVEYPSQREECGAGVHAANPLYDRACLDRNL